MKANSLKEICKWSTIRHVPVSSHEILHLMPQTQYGRHFLIGGDIKNHTSKGTISLGLPRLPLKYTINQILIFQYIVCMIRLDYMSMTFGGD